VAKVSVRVPPDEVAVRLLALAATPGLDVVRLVGPAVL
jgi:hypothetical protein